MGGWCSTPEAPEVKLLLLGIGGVGKSTVFKQIRILHATGFTPDEIEAARITIVKQMVHILLYAVTYGLAEKLLDVTPIIEEANDALEKMPETFDVGDEEINNRLKSNICALWGNGQIKTVIEVLKKGSTSIRHSTFSKNSKITEAELEWIDYFFDRVNVILDVRTPLADEDLFKLRRETKGAQKITFKYNNNNMCIVDVGGQIHERTTWETEYDNVLAVIYMVSLADYNQFHQSKSAENKLQSSIQLFKDLTEVPQFAKTPFVILLNKSDVFERKLKDVGFSCFMESCDASLEHDYHHCLSLIEEQFTSVVREANVYTYITNATDTTLIANVFMRLTHAVTSQGLEAAGLT